MSFPAERIGPAVLRRLGRVPTASLSVALVWLVAGGVVLHGQQRARALGDRQARLLGRVLEDHARHVLETTDRVLAQVSRQLAGQRFQPFDSDKAQRADELLSDLAGWQPLIQQLSVVRRSDGGIVLSSRWAGDAAPVPSAPLLQLRRPLPPADGSPTMDVVARIDGARLNREFAALVADPAWTVRLVALDRSNPSPAASATTEAGAGQVPVSLASLGASVEVLQDESQMLADWRHDARRLTAAAAAVTLVIGALGWGMRRNRRRQQDVRDEREQAQRQLREHYEMTEQLVDAMPLPVFLTDLQGNLLMANRAFVEWLQLEDEPPPGVERDAHRARLQALLERGLHEVSQVGHASWPVDLERHGGALRETVLTKVAQHRAENGQVAAIIGTLIDVTEYRQAARATERARQAAEAVSAAKAEFVANVSHELRTPLQSIIGFAELGEMRAQPGDRALAMFKRIEGGGRRMLRLVEDLLDLSRIGSTIGSVRPEPADPVRALRDVVDEMTPLAAEKSMHLRFESRLPDPAGRGRVMLDVPRYQQVARNVLANALKFAPGGSRIDVRCEIDQGHAVTTVMDQGPGIPVGETEAIFDPFVQSSRTKDGSGGTGLGLAICRQIMQAHGGFITAANHAEGGAVFRFGVPVNLAHPAAPAIDDGHAAVAATVASA